MKKDLLEILNALQEKYSTIQTNLNLEDKKSELETLNNQMSQTGFWDDPDNAQKVSQKASHVEIFIKKWQSIESDITDLPELIELSSDNEIADLQAEVNSLEKNFEKAETELFLSGEHDSKNVILSINTGNGGQDAEDFSQMLLRMYLRFCERNNFKTKIIDESPSDAGLKSATIEIKGTNAFGMMKSENGVHRLIRLSPFNSKNLRQTSFSRVEILPEIESDTELVLDEKDIRIDVFRSSGAGGQSVNTTDSAVRITYQPLNISVSCQNERSQLQNKETAMKVLKSKLLQIKMQQNAEDLSELRGEVMENSFGSQIRTYTLQPYKLVKDHRTNVEHSNPDKVFDGDLDGFIGAFLRKK